MRALHGVFDLYSSTRCHLCLAQEALRDNNPRILAERFGNSVEHFSRYSNIDESFYDNARISLPNHTQLNAINGTIALTAFLQGNAIHQVNNQPILSFRYVDREIVPARTTGRACFENGEPSTNCRRPDLLLANSTDGFPIIAEVKVNNDRNPFYALIQLLMYAAELATENQIARLQRHYPNQFRSSTISDKQSGPVVDLYIILCNYNPRSRIGQEILRVTDQLCERLVEEEGISNFIRRIACLDVKLTEERTLSFSSLFCHSVA